jgi:hypothetical protein
VEVVGSGVRRWEQAGGCFAAGTALQERAWSGVGRNTSSGAGKVYKSLAWPDLVHTTRLKHTFGTVVQCILPVRVLLLLAGRLDVPLVLPTLLRAWSQPFSPVFAACICQGARMHGSMCTEISN